MPALSLLFLYNNGYHKSQEVQEFKPTQVKDVVSGKYHALFLTYDKRVFVYAVQEQELFVTSSIFKPVLLKSVEDIEVIASGLEHAVMIKANGNVYGIGKNSHGQLGIEKESTIGPELISENADAIFCTAYATILRKGNELWCAGKTQVGCGTFKTFAKYPFRQDWINLIKMVTGHENHTLVLLETGQVLGYGSNKYGELGLSKFTDYVSEPIIISSLPEPIKHMACESMSSCFVSEAGHVYICGSDALSMEYPCYVPTKVELKRTIERVFCARETTFLVTHTNEILEFLTKFATPKKPSLQLQSLPSVPIDDCEWQCIGFAFVDQKMMLFTRRM